MDLTDLGENDVQVSEDKVSICLPEPEVLSSSLDEEKTAVYDRSGGFLSFLRTDDQVAEEARDEAVQRVEDAARENGILDQAESNAEDSIRPFVNTLRFEEVEFVS